MTIMVALLAGMLVTGGCGAAKKANEAREAVGNAKEVAENPEKGTSGDKKLDALLARAEKAQTATFRAEYEMGDDGSTLVLIQKGKKSRWETKDGDSRFVMIDDGTDSFSCYPTGEDETMQCTNSEGAGGGGSMAGMTAGFSPVAMLASIRTMLPLLGASLDVEHFSDTKGGEDVDCVKFTFTEEGEAKPDEPSTFCVTKAGVWAYTEDGGGQTIELIDFSEDVSDDDFELPGEVVDPADGYPGVTTSTTEG